MKGRTDIIKHILKEECRIPREKTKLAYLAGLIDGEGCLRINKENRIGLTITNTQLGMIEWVKENFGGRIYFEEKSRIDSKWMDCYKIEIRKTKDVVKILEAIKPYLTIKQEKAEELIKRGKEIIKRYTNNAAVAEEEKSKGK
jgi:intein/homing endonuclease